jgi:orotidine 5'-phosphate decarboxylase subfamily 2
MGTEGLKVLEQIRASIPDNAILIMDAKRGDIGNTSQAYAKAFYENLKSDSVTLSPYMGKDSVEPFLDYPGTCSFVLCLTSNPSSSDFQLQTLQNGQKLYEWVAQTAIGWEKGKNGEVGLVVGATQTQYLRSRNPGWRSAGCFERRPGREWLWNPSECFPPSVICFIGLGLRPSVPP